MQHVEGLALNGPELEEVLPNGQSRLILQSMGFVDPFKGTLAERLPDSFTYCWAGGYALNDEAVTFLAVTPKLTSLEEAQFLYGVMSKSDVESTDDPVELILEASVYPTKGDTLTYRLLSLIRGLQSLMPVSIEFDNDAGVDVE